MATTNSGDMKTCGTSLVEEKSSTVFFLSFFFLNVTGTRADPQKHCLTVGGDDLDFLENSCWNGSGSFQGTCQLYTALVYAIALVVSVEHSPLYLG